MSEHQNQCDLFQWAAIKSRQIPELEYLFAVPNGGFRSKVTAARLKAEGVKAGVPDVCLPVPRGQYHGAFIEMKFGKNKPTASQVEWIKFLEAQGYWVAVCYTWSEAADMLVNYLRS